MSPWDELKYIQAPAYSSIANIASNVVAIAANPMRIGLIMRMCNSAGTATVSLLPGQLSTTGIAITSQNGLELSHQLYPGLPQREWFISAATANAVQVIEVLLKSWPEEGQVPEYEHRVSVIPGLPSGDSWDNG